MVSDALVRSGNRRAASDSPVSRLLATFAIDAWLLGMLALALVLGEMPLVLATWFAPAGHTGVGTIWFINDFAQYESAMRQGASSTAWTIYDQFTGEPHAPALMFPLYVGIGKLAALLHVSASALERAVEIVARGLLVVALWRFCTAFASSIGAARWAFVLALFGSGFEIVAGALGLSYTGNWSYETNGFGLLYAAPHVPLGMAASLALARDGLLPRSSLSAGWLIRIGVLSAAVALLHPFHQPVLLAAMFVAGVVFWRTGRGPTVLVGSLVAGACAIPVLLPTVLTFSFDPFWGRTYSVQNLLPSPLPHEMLIELGPTLVLALIGAFWLRAGVAPFGLVVWVLFALIAMYAPVPYQRRFSFGLQPALAVMTGTTLLALATQLRPRQGALLRQVVLLAALSSSAIVLAGALASTMSNAPLPIYRSTPDLDAAAAWLNDHAHADEVILADWDAANYLAPRTPARVFGGHPVATLHQAQKQVAVETIFGHTASISVADALGVQWLVYGPAEADRPAPADPAFRSGVVRVYRVG